MLQSDACALRTCTQDVAQKPDVAFIGDLCDVVCSKWNRVLQGTRDYNVGDGADVSVQAAVQQMGLQIPENFQARQINPERDIVCFDVVLVMDKFTAADVLREVSNWSCLRPMEPCHMMTWYCCQSMLLAYDYPLFHCQLTPA